MADVRNPLGGSLSRHKRLTRLDPASWRTITREQWLLDEVRTVARLRVDEGLSNDEIVRRSSEQNIFHYPTEVSRANMTRVCLARLASLENEAREAVGTPATAQAGPEAAALVSPAAAPADVAVDKVDASVPDESAPAYALTSLLANGTGEQARQVNLYLLMRSYRLVREFMLDLVAPKLAVRDGYLTRAEVTSFLNDLALAHPEVASWSSVTLGKYRQVLMRSLSEAGYIGKLNSAKKEYELMSVLLDPEVERAIHDNGDADWLRAFRAGA